MVGTVWGGGVGAIVKPVDTGKPVLQSGWPQSLKDETLCFISFERENIRASRRPPLTHWIVVHAHRPMYCVEAGPPDWPKHQARPPGLQGRCDWEKEAARQGVPSACAGDYAREACLPRRSEEVAASYASVSSPPLTSSFGSPRRSDAGGGGGGWYRALTTLLSSGRVATSLGVPRTRFPIEDLFYRYGVDLAFFGHVHDYERFYPVYDEVRRRDELFEPCTTWQTRFD